MKRDPDNGTSGPSRQNLRERLLNPRRIAVIAADPGRGAARLVAQLLDSGFAGAILPVIAGVRAMHGVLVYDSIDALPVSPDLAILDLPVGEIPAALAALGAKGTGVALVQTEAEPSTAERIVHAAHAAGLRLIGPGSSGLILPSARVNASPAPRSGRRGQIAVIARGSALPAALLDWAEGENLGFSGVLSLGAGADIDYAEAIDLFAGDGRTRAILVHVESNVDARRFLSAARAAARAKPVVVCKPGHHDELAALDLQSSDGESAFGAAMRRAGVVRVDDFDELCAAAMVLNRPRPLLDERVAILANGPVPAAMALDALEARGAVLAGLADATREALGARAKIVGSAVVDIGERADPDLYRAALTALLADQGVGAVLVLNAPTADFAGTDIARAVAAAAADSAKPVLAGWLGGALQAQGRRALTAAGIPGFATPRLAAAGYAHLVAQRRLRRAPPFFARPRTAPPRPDRQAARDLLSAALEAGHRQLDPTETADLLAAYRVAPGVANSGTPAVRVDIKSDPNIGPVLRLTGPDGQSALDLPPLDPSIALGLIARAKIDCASEVERSGLALALCRLAAIIADLPEVETLTVPALGIAADGQAHGQADIVACPKRHGKDRLAIRPYPGNLTSVHRLRDGRVITLRPIRAEDEPAHINFLEHISPEDMRLRFFGPITFFERDEITRFTHIDYDREMAFVATIPDHQGGEETLGVARTIDARDGESAEFAVIVRSDMKQQGLGRALMKKLIAYARDHGLKRLTGDILAENEPMRRLARHLGFVARPMMEASAVEVTLDLSR